MVVTWWIVFLHSVGYSSTLLTFLPDVVHTYHYGVSLTFYWSVLISVSGGTY